MMTNRLRAARYTASRALGIILEVSDDYDVELHNLLDVENDHRPISGPSNHSDTESVVDANSDL